MPIFSETQTFIEILQTFVVAFRKTEINLSDEYRRAFKSIYFDIKTIEAIENLRPKALLGDRKYAAGKIAILLRDSEKDVRNALLALENDLDEDTRSIMWENKVYKIQHGKLSLRRDITSFLHAYDESNDEVKNAAIDELLDQIKILNETIVELDSSLGGLVPKKMGTANG